jgi:glyoxylase-like metal-dependent hydrolase (beta-lactamase superfamily II)
MSGTDIERVLVDARTRAPGGKTAAYVVGTESALLVDPAGRTDRFDELVADRDVGHVAVTHHHPDHVGAVADYAREYDLTVWARYGRVDALAAATGVDADRTFREGTRIPAGDGVEIVGTPGHAPEHVAFAVGNDAADVGDEHAETLVTGDLAVAEGSVVVGAPGGDMRAYLTSLRRVHAREPARLLPAHGPTISDPRENCARLLSHRLDREARIRTAVQEGVDTPEALVESVYEKDVSGVFELARATVVAHLEKLAVEGDVRWDGHHVRPT